MANLLPIPIECELWDYLGISMGIERMAKRLDNVFTPTGFSLLCERQKDYFPRSV